MNGPSLPERLTGTVTRSLADYCFISSPSVPGADIYFRHGWLNEGPKLQETEAVSFTLKTYEGSDGGTRFQATRLVRVNEPIPSAVESSSTPPELRPIDYVIHRWAYLGHLPATLNSLAGLALPEEWEFQSATPDPRHPHPILYNYLLHTFGRLVLEEKIRISDNQQWAAFNTGLVDHRYEPIHALFRRAQGGSVAWQLDGFCIPGEGSTGQNLVRFFAPLPEGPHYFSNPIDLLYDVRAGKPELDWHHIIIERIDRYPLEFLEDHWPEPFPKPNFTNETEEERKAYYDGLGQAYENDKRLYRQVMNRVKDAIELSIKRVSWNFKTAVPQYYPHVKRLQLLLPLCLLSDDEVDLALAVEKTESGSYLGHTVFGLDWAYMNARLVCRPDSDWLATETITEAPLVDTATVS